MCVLPSTPSVFLILVQVSLKIQNKLTSLWESDVISKKSLRVIKDIVEVKTLLMTTSAIINRPNFRPKQINAVWITFNYSNE